MRAFVAQVHVEVSFTIGVHAWRTAFPNEKRRTVGHLGKIALDVRFVLLFAGKQVDVYRVARRGNCQRVRDFALQLGKLLKQALVFRKWECGLDRKHAHLPRVDPQCLVSLALRNACK
jgi:hypothetical protein